MTDERRPHTNGAHPESMHTRSQPFRDDEPIDLVAVQADDELISALAAGMTVSAPGVGGYDADDQVAALLAAWRSDVDAEPIPELVDLDTGASTVGAASRPQRRRRHLVSIAAAAAIVVLSAGGVGVGAQSAEPGDTLWGVSRVLYSERAESLEAAERVEVRIAEARDALASGRPEVAAQALAQAQAELDGVRAEEGQAQLAEVQSFLQAKARETPPGQRTEPGTPLASDPTRPVPPGAAGGDPRTGAPTTSADPPVSPTSDGSPEPSVDPRTLRDPGSGAASSDVPTSSTAPAPPGQGEGTQDPTTPTPTPSGTAEGSADPTATSQGLDTSPTEPPSAAGSSTSAPTS